MLVVIEAGLCADANDSLRGVLLQDNERTRAPRIACAGLGNDGAFFEYGAFAGHGDADLGSRVTAKYTALSRAIRKCAFDSNAKPEACAIPPTRAFVSSSPDSRPTSNQTPART